MRRTLLMVFPMAVFALTLAGPGCHHKGTAQRAGEKMDRAADKVDDAIDPKGPAEKAGRTIDRAVDDAKH